MSSVKYLYRYPVKGLSGDLLTEATLTPDKGIPHDRQFAIALGNTDFDPANPVHMTKRKFLMLMRDVKLAELKTSYNPSENKLTILHKDTTVFSGDLNIEANAIKLGLFFDAFMEGKTQGGAHLVSAKGHMFTDIPEQSVSLINLSSVTDLEDRSGLEIDPLRFRGNIYVKGLAPWTEEGFIGKEFTIGEVVFRGRANTGRCAAVNVNLETATCDMNIPLTLKKTYGHTNMGIYADIVKGGTIRPGDTFK